jgi:hypothetical protein
MFVSTLQIEPKTVHIRDSLCFSNANFYDYRRYGFPNQEAISAGQSGSHCRGEEHDVSLVWSVSSGKRMIMSNGKQLYVGVNKASIFEQQWIDTRGNTIKLTAHAAPPISNASSSRQYDLIINGKSFFDLPKSYEIGLKGPADVRTPGIITATNQMMVQAPQRVAPVYSESGRNMVPQSQEEVRFCDCGYSFSASFSSFSIHIEHLFFVHCRKWMIFKGQSENPSLSLVIILQEKVSWKKSPLDQLLCRV